jgi:hypothetical protein
VGGVFFVFVYTGSSSYTCIPPCHADKSDLKVARKVEKLHFFSLVAIYTPSPVFKEYVQKI